MKTHLAIAALLGLTTCQGDETISGYADPRITWSLQELDGTPFPARATIRFPEAGKLEGQAPCNAYSASQTAPYPWFAPGPVLATKMACPDLQAEATFFAALARVTLVEVAGQTLLLSDDAGFQMVFAALP